MKTLQVEIKRPSDLESAATKLADLRPHVILAFGAASFFETPEFLKQLGSSLPGTLVFGCSTAGEISTKGVQDNSLVLTGLKFEKPDTRITAHSAPIQGMSASFDAGKDLASKIDPHQLKSVMVLGRGLDINGSGLIEGMRASLGPSVILTGGLAGDGGAFKRTFTICGGEVASDRVTALAFYGSSFSCSFGSFGGWEPFGPIRKVTRSENNIMYELDGEPALAVYKKYLGDLAAKLPASGLMYPFALLKGNQDSSGIIRTILGIDEQAGSLTFAGDIPNQGFVRLMHSKNEGLVQGAGVAATAAWTASKVKGDGLGILISCVGRKIVMGDDIEEEIDAVRDVFGTACITGFYSYGEICPTGFSECKLHNQTMTITHLGELM